MPLEPRYPHAPTELEPRRSTRFSQGNATTRFSEQRWQDGQDREPLSLSGAFGLSLSCPVSCCQWRSCSFWCPASPQGFFLFELLFFYNENSPKIDPKIDFFKCQAVLGQNFWAKSFGRLRSRFLVSKPSQLTPSQFSTPRVSSMHTF